MAEWSSISFVFALGNRIFWPDRHTLVWNSKRHIISPIFIIPHEDRIQSYRGLPWTSMASCQFWIGFRSHCFRHLSNIIRACNFLCKEHDMGIVNVILHSPQWARRGWMSIFCKLINYTWDSPHSWLQAIFTTTHLLTAILRSPPWLLSGKSCLGWVMAGAPGSGFRCMFQGQT